MTYARLLSVLTAVLLFAFTVPVSAADLCGHPGADCEGDADCCSHFCEGDCLCGFSGGPCEIDEDCCTGVCATGTCAELLAPTPTPASVGAPALGSPTSPAFALTALALCLAGAALLSRRVLRDD